MELTFTCTNPAERCFASNHEFYSIFVRFINLSWRRLSCERAWFKSLLKPLQCESYLVTRARLRPCSWHHTDLSQLPWSCITSWTRVTQGWLGSHLYAHSSSALCMRWQDSQAQAVSPESVCPDLPLLNATHVILNELKGAKIKLKKKRGTSRWLRRLSQRKAALINECVHMCFSHVTQLLLSWCSEENISPPLCPDYLHSLRFHVPTFWSHFKNGTSFITDLRAAGIGKKSTITCYYPSVIWLV